ncbi:MAG: serine hydrolase domain-containing protein [Microthrixaceae bacterium]
MGTRETAVLNPLDESTLAKLRARIQREVDDGRVPAAQIAIGLDGEVVHRESFGSATDDSRFAVFSVTKAFIAAVIWQLLGEGALEIDTPVTELVPSFAAAREVTLKNLLTHTGGFPYAPLGPPRWETTEGRSEQYGSWTLQYPPGERFEYHATSGHWIIAEMIEAIEGADYRTVVAKRARTSRAHRVRPRRCCSGGDRDRGTDTRRRGSQRGGDRGRVRDSGRGSGGGHPDILLHFNHPEVRAVGLPAAGGVSDAATIAEFYQCLLHNKERLWKTSVLADGTARVHCNLPDPLRGVAANRTLGLVLAGDDGNSSLRGMGHTVSPQTFGHNGAAGQIAWADPATGMSFAFCTSGVERNFLHEARRTAALSSLAGNLPRAG